jgi:hypothetical protein
MCVPALSVLSRQSETGDLWQLCQRGLVEVDKTLEPDPKHPEAAQKFSARRAFYRSSGVVIDFVRDEP